MKIFASLKLDLITANSDDFRNIDPDLTIINLMKKPS